MVHECEDYIHFDCNKQWQPEWTENLAKFSKWDEAGVPTYFHGKEPSHVYIGCAWYAENEPEILNHKFMIVTCKGYSLDILKVVEEGWEKYGISNPDYHSSDE